MTRTKRFVRAVSAGYLNQLIVMLAGVWMTPYLLHHLGQHDYGLWLISLQILTYLGLAEFGIIALLPRDVAVLTGRLPGSNGALQIRGYIEEMSPSVCLQTALVAIGAAFFMFLLPHDWELLRKPIGLTMLAFTVLFPFRFLQATIEGLQRQADVTIIATAGWLLGLATNVSLVTYGYGLTGLAIGWIVYQVTLVLGCAIYLFNVCPDALPRKINWQGTRMVIPRLRRGSWLSLQQIAQILLNGTDLLIIGRFLGPSIAVPYSCTGKLNGVMSNQPSMLMQTAMPGLSQLRAARDQEKIQGVAASLTLAMMVFSGACAAMIIGTNQSFVTMWVGRNQFLGIKLTALLLLLTMIRHLNLTLASMAFSFGHERQMCAVALVEGGLGFGLSVWLTSWLGVYGVVLGGLLSLCCTSLLSNLMIVSREVNLSTIQVIQPLLPLLWRLGVSSAVGLIGGRVFHPANFLQLAILGGAILSLYLCMVVPIIIKTPLGSYLQPLLAGILGRSSRFFSAPLASPRGTPGE